MRLSDPAQFIHGVAGLTTQLLEAKADEGDDDEWLGSCVDNLLGLWRKLVSDMEPKGPEKRQLLPAAVNNGMHIVAKAVLQTVMQCGWLKSLSVGAGGQGQAAASARSVDVIEFAVLFFNDTWPLLTAELTDPNQPSQRAAGVYRSTRSPSPAAGSG